MQNTKKKLLPFRHGVPLSNDQRLKTSEEEKMMRQICYASTMGSLMYVMLCTRLDICYSIGMVSRYQSNPRPKHWEAVKHILKYLRRTKDYMLVYHCEDLIPIGYTDSGFNQILISESPLQVMCSPWEVKPLVGGVLNNLVLLTPPWKLNMLLLVKQQRKLFGSRNSFLILVL